jgi:hypothetical protein
MAPAVGVFSSMAPAIGVFCHGPVGAQDDDYFLTNIHGGLLGYTPPHAIFMAPAVGGVAHGPVNARP